MSWNLEFVKTHTEKMWQCCHAALCLSLQSKASDMRFDGIFEEKEIIRESKRQRVINSRYRGDYIEPVIYRAIMEWPSVSVCSPTHHQHRQTELCSLYLNFAASHWQSVARDHFLQDPLWTVVYFSLLIHPSLFSQRQFCFLCLTAIKETAVFFYFRLTSSPGST